METIILDKIKLLKEMLKEEERRLIELRERQQYDNTTLLSEYSEIVNTYNGWKEQGRKVKRGETPRDILFLWNYNEDKNGVREYFKIRAGIFTINQTEVL